MGMKRVIEVRGGPSTTRRKALASTARGASRQGDPGIAFGTVRDMDVAAGASMDGFTAFPKAMPGLRWRYSRSLGRARERPNHGR
jgi:hypothetical protein